MYTLNLHAYKDHQGRYSTPKGGNTLGNQYLIYTGVTKYLVTPFFLSFYTKFHEKSNNFN
jgi:hypothetical protein